MTDTSTISALATGLLTGSIKVVDLSAPLGPDTPVLYLPPQFGKNTPNVKVHTISAYDQDGPFWAWNWLELGEHTGTHFDAPSHWITGKDNPSNTTDTIAPQNFVAPVNVIDRSKESAENPDYLLTVDSIKEWEAEHGEIEAGTWVLLRTEARLSQSARVNLSAQETGASSGADIERVMAVPRATDRAFRGTSLARRFLHSQQRTAVVQRCPRC